MKEHIVEASRREPALFQREGKERAGRLVPEKQFGQDGCQPAGPEMIFQGDHQRGGPDSLQNGCLVDRLEGSEIDEPNPEAF